MQDKSIRELSVDKKEILSLKINREDCLYYSYRYEEKPINLVLNVSST